MIARRDFIGLLGGAAAAWPLAARAQQGEHVRTIGILASQPLPPIQRFARKLRDYGYIEGQNLRLVSRFAEGRDDRYPDMAAELAALPVDLIVTWGTPAALAAKQATKTIPVVMGSIGDPVSVGIVPNLARPGGNITGFAAQNVDLEETRATQRLSSASLSRCYPGECRQPIVRRFVAEAAPCRRAIARNG